MIIVVCIETDKIWFCWDKLWGSYTSPDGILRLPQGRGQVSLQVRQCTPVPAWSVDEVWITVTSFAVGLNSEWLDANVCCSGYFWLVEGRTTS